MYCQLGWSQECRHTIQSSFAAKRFASLKDGTVMDYAANLVWMRCSVGQTWDNKTQSCSGDPTPLTWPQAKQSADDTARQLKASWRLPSLQELSSIAQLRCYDPAIDLRWFPNTPSSHYWTGTPFVNLDKHYWLVQFLTGENDTDSVKRTALVRLVKSIPQ
jgi:hypothetical protein